MSAWEAEPKSPEQLRGTNGKLFQNVQYILYNGNTNGYPMLSNGNYPTSVYPDNLYPDWNQLTQRFCGSQWIKWIRNLKMKSKIKLIKVERILVQVVPRFYEMMMIGEPPNHRTVQRDDLRIAQHFWGDWSPLRSSTIIPSPVHIQLIQHPMSMVPMWKFPISTMVSLCVFFERGKGKKTASLSIQDEAHCSRRRISMQRIRQYFADIWDHFWGVDIRGMQLISLIKPYMVQSPIILFNYSNIKLLYLHVFYQYLWFHSFFTSSITRVLHSSRLTPQVLSSSQGNILEDEAAVQVSRIVEWSLRKVPRFFS